MLSATSADGLGLADWVRAGSWSAWTQTVVSRSLGSVVTVGERCTPYDRILASVVTKAVSQTFPQVTGAQSCEISDRVAKWLRQSGFTVRPVAEAGLRQEDDRG